MRVAIVVFACFVGVGCASSPTTVGEAIPIPSNRLVAFHEPPAREYGRLIITRDGGTTVGRFCDVVFAINGMQAATVRTSETALSYVEPGELLLRAAWSEGCNAFVKGTQRETLLKANETKRFRITVDGNGNLDVQRAE